MPELFLLLWFPFHHPGVPEKPEINGLTKPAMEGDHITLTCITQGSKPAADLRWFRNEKEVKGTSCLHLYLNSSRLLLHRCWMITAQPDNWWYLFNNTNNKLVFTYFNICSITKRNLTFYYLLLHRVTYFKQFLLIIFDYYGLQLMKNKNSISPKVEAL